MFVLILTLISLVSAVAQCPPIPVATCSGLTQAKCTLSYLISTGATKNPCTWSGSSCTTSTSYCAPYCPASGIGSCSSASAATCEGYYITNGFYSQKCLFDAAASACASTPTQICNVDNSAAACPATLASGGCAAVTVQATCAVSYQVGAHGGAYKCAYTSGVGCYANKPCFS